MSLRSLMVHTATVKLERDTTGPSGAGKVEEVTVATIRCRIQPVSALQRVQYLKSGMDVTHRMYCDQNPQVDTRHVVYFNGRRLYLVGSVNFDELGRLWRVELTENTHEKGI